MTGDTMIPDGDSHPLPPYRGLLAVDVIKFTDNRDRHLPELSAMIPDVLEQAFSKCGQDHIWQEKRFPELPGDGYVFGITPQYLPFLIHPFLDSLQTTLWELSPSLRARDRALTMRLRVSIHVGPVYDQDDPLRDRKGKTTNDAFRLLNSDQLREVMAHADSDVTLVGAIISERAFQDVVEGGYTAVHGSQFRRVAAEVPEKDFKQHAWIYVPRPTFLDGTPGTDSHAAGQRGDETDQQAVTGASPVFHERVGQAFTGGTFHGDFTFRET
ncbi:hypothetical protein ACIBKY_00495 [Nonomuraea sp. NPDC050394]|uniref:hypothetical protein n=1 Tax=Nonomuraea sp. NPDC050394 TaxID=3364363 RepID=UPI003799E9AA